MIDPRDIFNAHRVVGAARHREAAPLRRPPIGVGWHPGPIGGGWRPGPLGTSPASPWAPRTLLHPQRRRVLVRTVASSIGTRARNVRAVVVRTVLPALRKR